ncbi:hypothetical protein ACROYT_G036170 [Oculina patagonica]
MAVAPDPDEVLRSTRAKGNFQRLARLLISGGTTLLREVFDQICPPRNLPTILKNPATEKQLKAAKLTKPQWDCLNPSPGVYGKSEDCDVTLLFKLLRTICNLTPPTMGWDVLPTTTDHRLGADLARIKYYRNSVYGHVNQNMELADDEFPSLWQNVTKALVRIAGQISPTKKHEDPLTAEDERNVQELLKWYENDTDVKQSIEKFKTSTQEGIERLEKRLIDVQEGLEGTVHVIEETGQFVENAVQEEAKGIKDQLGEELKTATQRAQGLVLEEAQDIKGQLEGLGELTQNVQCLVLDEAQDIKDQLEGELKTTAQKFQSLVRDEAQEIKDKLDEVHQSIDGLRSTAGSSQASEVQIRVRMNCEAIPGPGPRGGASEMVTTSPEPQPSVQSATAPYQQQAASSMAPFSGENVPYTALPPTQEVLNFIAHKYFQGVDTSKPEELNGFLRYLREVRNVLVLDAKQGSLIITLECSSLEILDKLWKDYCLGHLDEMAEKFLVTEEVRSKFRLTTVKLTTTIQVEEYTACRQYLIQSEGEFEGACYTLKPTKLYCWLEFRVFCYIDEPKQE